MLAGIPVPEEGTGAVACEIPRMRSEPTRPSVLLVKYVYWAWTAIGVGAVVFVFIGAHGWDNEGDFLTGTEVFTSIVVLVVVPAWIAGYIILWAVRRLALWLAETTRRHRLSVHH
jgi:hypothetical protein